MLMPTGFILFYPDSIRFGVFSDINIRGSFLICIIFLCVFFQPRLRCLIHIVKHLKKPQADFMETIVPEVRNIFDKFSLISNSTWLMFIFH